MTRRSSAVGRPDQTTRTSAATAASVTSQPTGSRLVRGWRPRRMESNSSCGLGSASATASRPVVATTRPPTSSNRRTSLSVSPLLGHCSDAASSRATCPGCSVPATWTRGTRSPAWASKPRDREAEQRQQCPPAWRRRLRFVASVARRATDVAGTASSTRRTSAGPRKAEAAAHLIALRAFASTPRRSHSSASSANAFGG
mmetsp:Transcript_16999/g.53215  ORF Transcript_16999/g.53215 Transcript_16999/m.53215 type:complete len:200 (+) Transcript_16999:449-1048(+)